MLYSPPDLWFWAFGNLEQPWEGWLPATSNGTKSIPRHTQKYETHRRGSEWTGRLGLSASVLELGQREYVLEYQQVTSIDMFNKNNNNIDD